MLKTLNVKTVPYLSNIIKIVTNVTTLVLPPGVPSFNVYIKIDNVLFQTIVIENTAPQKISVDRTIYPGEAIKIEADLPDGVTYSTLDIKLICSSIVTVNTGL
jgi:hypothetical protein